MYAAAGTADAFIFDGKGGIDAFEAVEIDFCERSGTVGVEATCPQGRVGVWMVEHTVPQRPVRRGAKELGADGRSAVGDAVPFGDGERCIGVNGVASDVLLLASSAVRRAVFWEVVGGGGGGAKPM